MSPELEQKLCKSYPTLFKNTEYQFINCGDGWYPLIDAVSRVFVAHNSKIGAKQIIKNGDRLYFYHSQVDDFSSGVTLFAGLMSKAICENCGALGNVYVISESELFGTRCQQHADQEGFDALLFEYFYAPEPGFGIGWSLIIRGVNQMSDFFREKLFMPDANFSIDRQRDKLNIELIGDNEMMRGTLALAHAYAAMIDEHSGIPHS